MASFFHESLALTIQTRKNYLSILEDINVRELNTIPIGFNNNIVWNIAHIVATADILFYSLNGLTPKLETSFIDSYRKGTKSCNQKMEISGSFAAIGDEAYLTLGDFFLQNQHYS